MINNGAIPIDISGSPRYTEIPDSFWTPYLDAKRQFGALDSAFLSGTLSVAAAASNRAEKERLYAIVHSIELHARTFLGLPVPQDYADFYPNDYGISSIVSPNTGAGSSAPVSSSKYIPADAMYPGSPAVGTGAVMEVIGAAKIAGVVPAPFFVPVEGTSRDPETGELTVNLTIVKNSLGVPLYVHAGAATSEERQQFRVDAVTIKGNIGSTFNADGKVVPVIKEGSYVGIWKDSNSTNAWEANGFTEKMDAILVENNPILAESISAMYSVPEGQPNPLFPGLPMGAVPDNSKASAAGHSATGKEPFSGTVVSLEDIQNKMTPGMAAVSDAIVFAGTASQNPGINPVIGYDVEGNPVTLFDFTAGKYVKDFRGKYIPAWATAPGTYVEPTEKSKSNLGAILAAAAWFFLK